MYGFSNVNGKYVVNNTGLQQYGVVGFLQSINGNITSNFATTNNRLLDITRNLVYSGHTAAYMLYQLWDDLEMVNDAGNTYSVAESVYGAWDVLYDYLPGLSSSVSSILGRLSYTANGKSYSVANSAYGIWEDVETLDGHVVNNGSLISKGFLDVVSPLSLVATRLSAADNVSGTVYNAAQYLTQIKNRLGDTYNGTYYTAGQLFRIIVSRLDTIRDNGVADASMVSKGLSDIYNRLYATDPMNNNSPANVAQYLVFIKNRLGDTYNGTYYTAGQLLRIIVTRLDTLRSNGVSRDSLISKGFSDVIAALDSREVVVTGDLQLGDVTVDNSDVVEQIQTSNALLGNIVDLLFLAGVKDVVDDFLGDFENLIGATQLASVQAAMQNAFPFCVPAIFKQVLGLLEYEGAPPVYEFDIAGAPLVLDFSVAEDFAEISRWVVTVSFVLFLLANTKRFVFDFSGGAS